MVEVGAPDECIDEMRSFLHLEGWSQQHEEVLPNGWMLRIAEGAAAVKCSLMRDDGELIEDWTEGLRCLEGLGKDTNKLEEMVAQKLSESRNLDNSPTSGREILVHGKKDNSDHFMDFKVKLGKTIDDVKGIVDMEADCAKANVSPNKLEISTDDVKNEKISGVDKNVSLLPKGWRTRNTLGGKGFRIYSPPGFELPVTI